MGHAEIAALPSTAAAGGEPRGLAQIVARAAEAVLDRASHRHAAALGRVLHVAVDAVLPPELGAAARRERGADGLAGVLRRHDPQPRPVRRHGVGRLFRGPLRPAARDRDLSRRDRASRCSRSRTCRARPPIAIGLGVAGFMQGGFIGLYAVGARIYPAAIRITGIGWAIGVARLGAVLGPYIAGVLVAGGMGMAGSFLVFAIPLAIAAIAVTSMRSPELSAGSRVALTPPPSPGDRPARDLHVPRLARAGVLAPPRSVVTAPRSAQRNVAVASGAFRGGACGRRRGASRAHAAQRVGLTEYARRCAKAARVDAPLQSCRWHAQAHVRATKRCGQSGRPGGSGGHDVGASAASEPRRIALRATGERPAADESERVTAARTPARAARGT